MDIIIIDGLSFALPLFIMAIGGIYCEKSGVTMLAVEGLQGFGAFTGALVAVLISGLFSGNTPIPFYIAMLFAAGFILLPFLSIRLMSASDNSFT